MVNRFIARIRGLLVDAVGYFSGQSVASKFTDNKKMIDNATTAGWLAGIHLNHAIDRKEAREGKDSVFYPDFLEEKMKYRDDHLKRYEKRLSDQNLMKR